MHQLITYTLITLFTISSTISFAQRRSIISDSDRVEMPEEEIVESVPSYSNYSSVTLKTETTYKVRIEAGTNYYSTVEKLKQLSSNPNIKVEYNRENKNYQNGQTMYIYKFKVSESELTNLYTYVKGLGKLIDTSTTQSSYSSYNDTMRIHRDIESYKLQLNKYKLILDTMSVLDRQFSRIQSSYKNVQNSIDQKYVQIENIKKNMQFAYRIEVEVYKNYKKYNTYNTNRWETYFVPGLAYTAMQPKAIDTLGAFSGLTPEITFFEKYNNKGSGPSFVKLYGKLGILGAANSENEKLFFYGVGAIASIENKISRKFAIPYFGGEFGTISQSKLGSSIYIKPQVGLYLYATKKLQVYAQGGYLYTVKNTLNYRTYSASFGFNFLLWR